mgnify:CR=1 FL=1
MWYNIQGGEGDNFGKHLASTRIRGYIRNFILALSFRTSAQASAQVTLVLVLSFRTGAGYACVWGGVDLSICVIPLFSAVLSHFAPIFSLFFHFRFLFSLYPPRNIDPAKVSDAPHKKTLDMR